MAKVPKKRTIQTKVSIEPEIARILRHIVQKSLPATDPVATLTEYLSQTEFTSRRHVAYARGLLDGLTHE